MPPVLELPVTVDKRLFSFDERECAKKLIAPTAVNQ